jgi:DNA-binding NarL/FixJ family response regulator
MDTIDFDTRQGLTQKTTELERLLTPRESNVLRLIGRGFSNKQIAQELQIAPETVKSHAKRIFTKLNAQTRAHAVARALGWRV